MSNKTSDSNKEIPPVPVIEAAKKPKPENIETVVNDKQTEILNAIEQFKQKNKEIASRAEADQTLEPAGKEEIRNAIQEADKNAQKAREEAEQSISAIRGKEQKITPGAEQEAAAPKSYQEKTPNPEKTEKKVTMIDKLKLTIALLIAFYGVGGGPGGTESNKNDEVANYLKGVSSQKIVMKANHAELVKFVTASFDSIIGGQEAAAVEAQAPLKEITMDSKQLEENLQRSQAAWQLWWENHPESKEAQIKEFDAWANSARLQAGDKVRILWRDRAQSSPSIKVFEIAGESNEKTMLLSDFLKAMANDLGDSYNPNNILNIEIDRGGQKLSGSLGFDPKSPAYPLLAGYLQSHLPKGNLEKPDDTSPIDLKKIENRTSRSEIPVQPYLYVFQSPPGGWLMAEKSPNTTIADTILAPAAVMPLPKAEYFTPTIIPKPAIRPAPETKPRMVTPGGPAQTTTINIEKQAEPSEKIITEKGLTRGLPQTTTDGENLETIKSAPKQLPAVELPTSDIAETANAKIPEKVQGILEDDYFIEKIKELAPSNGEKYVTADGIYFIKNKDGRIEYSMDNRKSYTTLPGEPSISPTGPKNIEIKPGGPSTTTVEKTPSVATNAPEKLPTIKQPSSSTTHEQESTNKDFGDYLAEKLAINGDDIDAVYDSASWDKLIKKMPSLTVNEELFLSTEDQKNPQVVEHFKGLIINKGEQKLKEIENDLAKNFEFPAKSLNDQKAIYDFASDKLKNAPKENKVAFFLLVNSHKRILDLRAEYTAKKK